MMSGSINIQLIPTNILWVNRYGFDWCPVEVVPQARTTDDDILRTTDDGQIRTID